MEKYNKYHESLNIDCECGCDNPPTPQKKEDGCCCPGPHLPSNDNKLDVYIAQLKQEIKKLLETTEARLLCQDKKIAETMVYVKNNLSNAIRNLLNSMLQSGELDKIITDTVLSQINLIERDITNLDIKIETETTNRKNEDQNLQNLINKCVSGSPLPVNSISQMTDKTRIYVNTSDGLWYYYNGTQWVDGGVYQSTQIADLSVAYQKIINVPNGKFNPVKNIGYMASQYNDFHDVGTIVNSGGENEYKRTDPIPLTKGMILMAFLKAPNSLLAIAKTDSNGNYISTIEVGKAGEQMYKYICQSDVEYVVLSSATLEFSPEYYLYAADFDFENLKPKNNGTYNVEWQNGYVSYNASSYSEGTIVKHDETDHRRTPFIKLSKGNILKIKACSRNNIAILSVYNNKFDFVRTVYIGSANAKYQDYNYIATSDCYVIVCNTILYVADPKIEFYKSVKDYVNPKVSWYDFFINQNGINYVEFSYQNTNEFLLRKGEVFDFYSGSTTDNAYKLYVSKNGQMIDGIVINNLDTTSEYYEKSYRGSYVAKQDCFIRLLNRINIVDPNDVEINIYPFEQVGNANIYNKILTGIGDSYLANHSQNPGLTWLNKIASKYGAKYNNLGKNGNGLVAGDNPIVSRISDVPVDSDFIIVEGGKNDYNNQISISDFKTGLRTLCSSIVSTYYKSKILFITPFDSYGANDPSEIKLEEYANAMIEVCQSFCMPIYDLFHNSNMFMWYSNFRSEYCQGSNDSSHLNAKGHDRLMNQCEKRIIEL